MNDKELISNANWIKNIIRPYYNRIVFSIFLVIIRSIILLCPPLLTKEIIDNIIPNSKGKQLIIFALGIALIPVISGALIILELKVQKYLLEMGGQIRSDILNGMLYCPQTYFRNYKTGDLLQRALEDTKSVFIFGYQGFSTTMWYLFTTLIGLIMMATLEWKLTLVIVLFIFIQTRFINLLGKKVKVVAQEVAAVNSKFTENTREMLEGITFIKENGKDSEEIEKIDKVINEHFLKYRKYIRIDVMSSFIQMIFICCIYCVLYLWGGILVISNEITVGTFLAMLSLYIWIHPALVSYFIMYIEVKKISPLVSRIREIIYPVSKDIPGLYPRSYEIEFNNVSFSYDGSKEIIKKINLSINQGEHIGIIGDSGSGKSTLVDLLVNLQKPHSGQIKIGTKKINEIDNAWYRRNIRCVSQDFQLSGGTLRDNILYMNPNTSIKNINEALRLASLDEWVSKLPDGLDTLIGEDGMQISGGERQRISFVQAILSKPCILILDEATASLDNITEEKITNNINVFLPNTTIIWITHRLSVLKDLDMVFKLENGNLKMINQIKC